MRAQGSIDGGAMAALEGGRAFVDRSSFRLVSVTGTEAASWMHDLLTADISGLRPGRARRSLLLSPTGRIRADVHVVRLADRLLLAQDPAQPAPIGELLAPYVLSADVALGPADDGLFCVPGAAAAPAGLPSWRPSMLGDGLDVVVPAAEAARARGALSAALRPVDEDAIESRRIRAGVARFPIDVGEDSVPAEAGLEDLIDFSKGCFLGQESAAKIRNLGRTPWIVLALRGPEPLAAGDPVLLGSTEAGRVTSATGRALLARVRREAAAGALTDRSGRPLARV